MGSACYFVSILTKLVLPRQSSLAVPTDDITEIHPLSVDRQTKRLAQGSYVFVALRSFYNYSKMWAFYVLFPNADRIGNTKKCEMYIVLQATALRVGLDAEEE
jgi:hypothetical protein